MVQGFPESLADNMEGGKHVRGMKGWVKCNRVESGGLRVPQRVV